MRPHRIYLPDLLNIVDLPDADIRRLTQMSNRRLARPAGTSNARQLGALMATRAGRRRLFARVLLSVIAMGLLAWLMAEALAHPPDSTVGRVARACILLAAAAIITSATLTSIRRARARTLLVAAASRARRWNPDWYAERLRTLPDPADASRGLWKREMFPAGTVLGHLVASLPTAQFAVIAFTSGPLVFVILHGAIAGPRATFSFGPILVGASLGLLTLTLTLVLGPATVRWRVESRTRRMVCSHCGYALASITTDTRGPRRCPECGCPWPLLIDDQPRW